MMSLLIFYEIVLAVSYVIIHGIASRHARDMIASNMAYNGQTHHNPESLTSRQFAATKVIIKIVLSFMLLHAPVVIHLIVSESNTSIRHERFRRIFHFLSYVCIQINSFISLRLYVFKFDECKLHLYLMLSCISKKYESKVEKLRVDVYDIVVYTKSKCKI
jgi:uncharacterized membrane protein YjgN (DUF898 family)